MNKRLTVIIYQSTLALPDVYRWAADNKFVLIPGKRGPLHYMVEREEEEIHLLPHTDNLKNLNRPHKLVLWGAFSEALLRKILNYMQ